MRKFAESLVLSQSNKLSLPVTDEAVSVLAEILDEQAERALLSAQHVARYAKKKSIDRESVEVAAFVNSRAKKLPYFKRKR